MMILQQRNRADQHQAARDQAIGLLAGLRASLPALAAQFTGLFSTCREGLDRCLVGVGSQFSLRAVCADGQLQLEWYEGTCLERVQRHVLDPLGEFHPQLFAAVARLMDEVRPSLRERHGLTGDTPLLGGWQCATDPSGLAQPLVFTLPRILLQVAGEQVSAQFFDESHSQLIAHLLDAAVPASRVPVLPGVVARQQFPECSNYVDNLLGLLEELAATDADKVVIGREVRLELDGHVDPLELLKAVAPRPNAHYEYLFSWDDGPAWVGISPETLVRKEQACVIVEPLAGTRKSSSDTAKNALYRHELMSDGKELEEHETAAALFFEQLANVCEPGSLQVCESRNILDLGYVQHLKSLIRGVINQGLNVFDSLAAIYPPATIWGKPLQVCGERIRRYETIERGFFTGGLGYFTLADDANFALAIRTAKVDGDHVHVYAGSGIVRGSDPYREWLETSNKMKPYLNNGSILQVS
jgi:isochorismate synthase EntC